MKKLKRADKNLKEFFADVKRDILDKNDEEEVLGHYKVKDAKLELKNRVFVRFLY